MTLIMNTKRQSIWRRRNLVIGIFVLLMPFIGSFLYNQFRTPGAMLTSENHMDRPIFSFWIDDFWGGNLFAKGGGGVMCCQRIKGPTVKVTWILSVTGEQYRRGMRKEEHELVLPLPERLRTDNYLHVRFLPGNTVELKWSAGLISPFPEVSESKNDIVQGSEK